MKMYYQHKVNGQVICSLNSIMDLVINGKITVVTYVIIPDIQLGNGVISHIMPYYEIRNNYKRISKKLALEIQPDFGQYRHCDHEHNKSVTYHGYFHLSQLKQMRKKGFGIAFTDYGKERLKKYG